MVWNIKGKSFGFQKISVFAGSVAVCAYRVHAEGPKSDDVGVARWEEPLVGDLRAVGSILGCVCVLFARFVSVCACRMHAKGPKFDDAGVAQ